MTLVEVLVVIAIIAVLAGLVFPALFQAKDASKKAACLSNLRQLGTGSSLYASDYDGRYPQTRRSSAIPDVEDVSGALDEPAYGSVLSLTLNYSGDLSELKVLACPIDPDPFGRACYGVNPDSLPVASYIANAFFVFGLSESEVSSPADSIQFAERRSLATAVADEFCDDIYHPWFSSGNILAPEIQMDAENGAVATQRHGGRSNFCFADAHTRNLAWAQTWGPTVNLHSVRAP